MSPTLEDRIDNWATWRALFECPTGWILRGYEHWCGSATLIERWDDYDGECCSGCRCVIARPGRNEECKPLFGLAS